MNRHVAPHLRAPLLRWVVSCLLLMQFGLGAAQRVGEAFVDFELKDAQGQLLRSDDLKGEMWLINVWASWCPPCRSELPLIATAGEELAGQGLNVLLLNAGESASVATAFLEGEGLSLRTLADPDTNERGLETTTQFLRRLRSRGLPTTYFVDADLHVRGMYVGELTPSVLAEQLATLGLSWSHAER